MSAATTAAAGSPSARTGESGKPNESMVRAAKSDAGAPRSVPSTRAPPGGSRTTLAPSAGGSSAIRIGSSPARHRSATRSASAVRVRSTTEGSAPRGRPIDPERSPRPLPRHLRIPALRLRRDHRARGVPAHLAQRLDQRAPHARRPLAPDRRDERRLRPRRLHLADRDRGGAAHRLVAVAEPGDERRRQRRVGAGPIVIGRAEPAEQPQQRRPPLPIRLLRPRDRRGNRLGAEPEQGALGGLGALVAGGEHGDQRLGVADAGGEARVEDGGREVEVGPSLAGHGAQAGTERAPSIEKSARLCLGPVTGGPLCYVCAVTDASDILPRTALPHEVLRAALEALDQGRRVVLATVVARHGSAPSTPGQKLALFHDRAALGTIGGGAVERVVLARMIEAQRDPEAVPRVETFRLGASLGMCCGGSVEVLIEPLEPLVHVLVVGAGHVGAFTAPLLASAGFRVTLCDTREAAADPERIPSLDGAPPAAHGALDASASPGPPRGARRPRRPRHAPRRALARRGARDDPRPPARSGRDRVGPRRGASGSWAAWAAGRRPRGRARGSRRRAWRRPTSRGCGCRSARTSARAPRRRLASPSRPS